MKAYLILENGMIFEGKSFGAKGDVTGEIVFTTGMTGYLETLTDLSYHGQIVLQTFPLIGNYGVIPSDFESASFFPSTGKEPQTPGTSVGVKGYIVKHPCDNPSNFRSEGNLDGFLKERGIVGLYDIDARALTKIIRENGVMNGKITLLPPTETDRVEAKNYFVYDAMGEVSSKEITKAGTGRKVALLDFGAKRGIADALVARGCEVWSFPHSAQADEIMKINPGGIMLSNGPGDPASPANNGIVETIRSLTQTGVPIFGICLGHQLLALANGYKTQKLKFGHRGANQPVREIATGRVFITSQNHGYAVVCRPEDVYSLNSLNNISFVNVNDGTCEGMEYGNSFSVQFHPEARGGPLDTNFLFDRFIKRMDAYAAG